MGPILLAVILVYGLMYGGLLAAGLLAELFGEGSAVWGIIVPIACLALLLIRLR